MKATHESMHYSVCFGMLVAAWQFVAVQVLNRVRRGWLCDTLNSIVEAKSHVGAMLSAVVM